ncbi:O-antigen polymerase [Providencia rettgeri]|uniref:O-antigen polymerase n=1 Tax=Providencia rettgeri TaxID=587 RepID=UPI001BA47B2B|nr:O-antigen polymerase [Providencia rettgeri]MBS0860887.1 oligosaccharide repeat unit polymerase [Providencia rettgeri]MBS0874966.1 oligosaccharide repeat unit polymerase [Providencia rettgeri]MBS0921894.1 oligosaccharide repeat unit polymerase [Providencia rettgeri]
MTKFLVIIPFIVQLLFSISESTIYNTALIYYSIFILSFFIFTILFSSVYIDIKTTNENKNEKFKKIIYFFLISLFLLKTSILLSKMASGLDYSAIRDYYFRSDDRISDLYLNSKAILYLYNYLYTPVFMYALLNSIIEKKGTLFWCSLFIIDGVITAGRFNLYIVFLALIFIRGINFKIILNSIILLLVIASIVHILRNNSTGIQDTFYSIYQYHVVPILIFEHASSLSIPGHIFPLDIIFSGYAIFFKFIPIDLPIFDNWYYLQDYLDEIRVFFPDMQGPFNAFGNISLYFYWEFLYFGAIFQAIIFAIFLALKPSDRKSKIFTSYILIMLFLSCFQAGRLLSAASLVFIILFFFIHKPKFKLKIKTT